MYFFRIEVIEDECVTPFLCGPLVVGVHGSPLGVVCILAVVGCECVRAPGFVELTDDKDVTSGACVVDDGMIFDAFTVVAVREDVTSWICVVVVTVAFRAFEVVEVRTDGDIFPETFVVVTATVTDGDTSGIGEFAVVTLRTVQ